MFRDWCSITESTVECTCKKEFSFPVALCGDIKQAFLQVRITEEERDALSFHWIKNEDPKQIDTQRFTRVLFGLVQSPFILSGTLEAHLESKKGDNINEIAEIKKGLYVDDFISRRINTTAVKRLKQLIINIFGEAQFTLHKWHSNVSELGDNSNSKEIHICKSSAGC